MDGKVGMIRVVFRVILLVSTLLVHHVANVAEDSGFKNQCIDTHYSPDDWWQYKWCSGKYIRQMHYDWDRNVVEGNNLIGNFIEEESSMYREVYRRAIADCKVDSGELLRRQAEVVISCCGAGAPTEQGPTFIRSVSEGSPCTYHLAVCSLSACAPSVEAAAAAASISSDTFAEAENTERTFLNNMAVTPQRVSGATSDLLATSSAIYEDDVDDDDYAPYASKSSPPPGSTSFSDFVIDQVNPRLLRRMPSDDDVQRNLRRVKEMFYHAYDSYIDLAMPEAELRPLTCDGGAFELIKIPLVTLIDTLDTLVIMGNHTEFRRAVSIITKYYESFDIDVNVSVFETNIRVLGGLLSAHLMAIDTSLGIYRHASPYDDQLLALSIDLAERLLPAFKTATGIPYGTVNLRYGVPEGETEIASTAGAGSLFVEFETLSMITGDRRYGEAANAATQALFARRSFLGLLGKHIHISTGQWFESSSGIGSNADSFYEYLIKGYLLSRRNNWFKMFADTYDAVKKHVQVGDWFTEVDMFNGKTRRNRVENLQAFWPGMEASLGLCDRSARLLNVFYAAWQDIGFLPEEFDQAAWLQGTSVNDSWYPLRPELIESTYHQYRATGDRSWLAAGSLFLDSIEKNTRTKCGYASISNIGSMEMSNNMPSYFLSETCKYLFLLFDETNFIHERSYLFSTEAHPIDPLQLLDTFERRQQRFAANSTNNRATPTPPLTPGGSAPAAVKDSSQRPSSSSASQLYSGLSLRCPKTVWWDYPRHSYDSQFIYTHPDASGEGSEAWHTSQRVGIHSINAAEIERLMRWSTTSPSTPFVPRDEVELAPFKRADTCYDEDGPAIAKPSSRTGNARVKPVSGTARHAPPPIAPQKQEVDGGPLGLFEVTIFSDGFLVFSKLTEETIEITNVGDHVAFVRELRNQSSRTVIGDQTTGKTITCTVSVESSQGAMLLDGPDHRLSCSISTFGSVLLPSSSVVANLHAPSFAESKMCKPLNAAKTFTQGHRLNKPGAANGDDGSAKIPKKVPWWWQLSAVLSLAGVGSRRETLGNDEAETDKVRGNIVLVQRGGCMFEDKAGFVQKAGGVAMIVANSEDVLFVMSGRKQADQRDQSPATAAAAAGAMSPESVTIPSVMITKSDSRRLAEAIEKDPGGARVRVDLAAVPGLVDTDLMGNFDFPKLRIGPNVVHVIGSGAWGVVLTSQNGKEWQLFIMEKNEILAAAIVTPWVALTSGKQPITTTVAGTINPLEIYRNALGRKCPSYISLDANDGVIIEK